MILAAFLFMKRMSEVTQVEGWKYIEDEDEDPDSISLRKVPEHTLVYEINGPMFFGATDKIAYVLEEITPDTKAVILRMRSVPAMDATALSTLRDLKRKLDQKNVTLIFSHVLEQPMNVMTKSGFIDEIEDANFCDSIDFALERASTLV